MYNSGLPRYRYRQPRRGLPLMTSLPLMTRSRARTRHAAFVRSLRFSRVFRFVHLFRVRGFQAGERLALAGAIGLLGCGDASQPSNANTRDGGESVSDAALAAYDDAKTGLGLASACEGRACGEWCINGLCDGQGSCIAVFDRSDRAEQEAGAGQDAGAVDAAPSTDCPAEMPPPSTACAVERKLCWYTAPGCPPGSGLSAVVCFCGSYHADGAQCDPL